MPILRVLDNHKYREYLDSDPQLKTQLSKLPEGLSSLDSWYGSSSGRSSESRPGLSFAVGFAHSIPAAPVSSDNSNLRELKELDKAGKGMEAIKGALALPMQAGSGNSPRIDALMSLAFGGGDEHELNLLASQALESAVSECEPADRFYYLSELAGGMIRFHRKMDAEKILLNDLADLNSELRALDAGEGDKTVKDEETSRQTNKLFWASVSADRTIAYLEAGIDPEKAIGFANAVTDPDLQALLYVDVARALLIKAPLSLLVRARYHNGNSVLRSYQVSGDSHIPSSGS
jgi:hypothetical protein